MFPSFSVSVLFGHTFWVSTLLVLLAGTSQGRQQTTFELTPLPKNYADYFRLERVEQTWIDLKQVEDDLKNGKLTGWMHAAAHDLGHYVFTYRNPNNFFESQNFSVTTGNAGAEAVLKTLNRHDKVTLKGAFASHTNPQFHLVVDSITVDEAYKSPIHANPFRRQAKLPDDLKGKTSFVGKVHAIAAEGRVLVMEYQDAIVPVAVSAPSWTETLYRGDKIRIHFKVRDWPLKPVHLSLDTSIAKPVEVIESLVKDHGTIVTKTGILAVFPKSPQITFDVFALHIQDGELFRNYTLVNFQDFDLFEKIRVKLHQLWQAKAATAKDSRNFYTNPEIKLQVTGRLNVVDPGQANPQLLIEKLDDISEVP